MGIVRRVNLFNAKPRPRVLFENVPVDLVDELTSLVPTAKIIDSDEKVHESEYDLLVTFAWDAGKRSKHLHVLSFGATVGDYVKADGHEFRLLRGHATLAHEISIPQGSRPALAKLLSVSVVPEIEEGNKSTWELPDDLNTWTMGSRTGDLKAMCAPLLHLGSEEFVYAFERQRSTDAGSGYSLSLPEETTSHALWLRTFLDLVSEIDPSIVPASVDWPTSKEWAPPALRRVVEGLESLSDDREKAIAAFDVRESSLNQELAEIAKEAEEGPQRMLTADGDELVAAVLGALQDLGFLVEDMDDHHDTKTGAKLEDLRITDPSDEYWTCLAEVKGYAKGAKVNDVPQITGRPSVAFTKETGDEPSTVWHIVNAWRNTDPSTRPKAIDNDDDLQPLTDAQGALIDTRDLFRAWRDVHNHADPSSVRASLKSALTRWTYHPPKVAMAPEVSIA
jgi:hypothetical protein